MIEKRRSLIIAKYKDGIIKFSQYNESLHHGQIYCPFCKNPPIRVTYNSKGFFMAWKGEGGHNCKGELACYFDVDWKGRDITEVKKNNNEGVDVIIDIKTLETKPISIDSTNEIRNEGGDSEEKYPLYTERNKVFRDVIRSVLHMKRILEKNEDLSNINFRFRTDYKEELTLKDVVVYIHNLRRSLHDKKNRFVVFRVDNVILRNEKIYINAYTTQEIDLTAKLTYPSKENKLKRFEGKYVIAYGHLQFSEKYNKYFLELRNDCQIRAFENSVAEKWFEGVEIKKYQMKNRG